MTTPSLEELGWRGGDLEEGLRPARVVSVYGTRIELWASDGAHVAAIRRMAKKNAPVEGGVAVGDWVAIADAQGGEVVVERVLPRRTELLRQAAGERAEPQAIAANVDTVMVVTSLDGDLNAARLDRYLAAIRAGRAEPLVVLAKADLTADAAQAFAVASALAPALLTSARTGLGVDELRARMPLGTTSVLVGSSGVGKSALVNALLGRGVQLEGEVREHDRRGRHTTTRRSLFVVPGAGLLADTPGLRELKPWLPGEASDSEDAFDDIADLAASCRYRDCRHEAEPGCAVRGAIDDVRLTSFHKLETERRERAQRQETHASVQQKRRARAYRR